jgi:hypothetical protein
MIFVTSDLHGYPLKCFQKLLMDAGFTDDDELYVLGDVIDRHGDGGVETLLWMMDMPNITLLLGNAISYAEVGPSDPVVVGSGTDTPNGASESGAAGNSGETGNIPDVADAGRQFFARHWWN